MGEMGDDGKKDKVHDRCTCTNMARDHGFKL
jgi:hypothetical protein